MNAVNYLRRLFTIGHSNEDPKIDQVFYYNFTAYISALIAIFSGFRFLLDNNFQNAFVLIVFFLLVFLNMFILPPNKKYETSSLVLITLLEILSIYIFYSNDISQYSWIFILLFPILSLSLIGLYKGAIYSTSLGLILIIRALIPVEIILPGKDNLFYLIFFSAYILIFILTYYILDSNHKSTERQVAMVQESEKELENKNDFISSLSHQLRTSLSNVMLVNNLIYKSGLTQNQKDLIVTLIASTNNLVESVDKIVNISTPEIIKTKERLVSFNLSSTIFSIKQLFLGRENLIFDIQVSPNIQNYIIGDPVNIKQIILNLIQNILFPVSGMAQKILIKILPDKETKTEINISFILETCHQKINTIDSIEGECFTIKSLSTADLSNTIRLIEQSGSVLITKHKDAITTYSYILTYQKDLNKKIDTEEEKHPFEEGPIELKNANVLLVEDNSINQKIVMLSLKSMVKSIDVANNGKEALDKFGMSKYDIILMDVQMPVMDGIIAAKKIREIEASTNTQTPIIAITANALSGDRENCFAVGMNDYISKPFQVDILIQKMKNLLEKQNKNQTT